MCKLKVERTKIIRYNCINKIWTVIGGEKKISVVVTPGLYFFITSVSLIAPSFNRRHTSMTNVWAQATGLFFWL